MLHASVMERLLSGLSDEQIPVLIFRDRTGSATNFILEKASELNIGAALKPIMGNDAILCTDSSKALSAAREIGIVHGSIN